MALKMPEPGNAQEPVNHDPHSQQEPSPVEEEVQTTDAPLPLIGKLRIAQQLQLLLVLFAILAGIAAFVIAVVIRLANLSPLLNNPVVGLWRASIALLLIAIALGVNKK